MGTTKSTKSTTEKKKPAKAGRKEKPGIKYYTIRLPEELIAKLKVFGRKQSQFVERAIVSALSNQAPGQVPTPVPSKTTSATASTSSKPHPFATRMVRSVHNPKQ